MERHVSRQTRVVHFLEILLILKFKQIQGLLTFRLEGNRFTEYVYKLVSGGPLEYAVLESVSYARFS